MLHKSATIGDIHSLVNWIVANAAARIALTVVTADIHKILYQTDTGKYYFLKDATPTWVIINPDGSTPSAISIAASDETTALTAGLGKVTFRMPKTMTVTSVKASLTTAQVGGTIFTVDIRKNGVSVFATKPTIDNTEKTTFSAAIPSVLNTNAFLDEDEIAIDINQIGDGTAKGLKVYMIGTF